MKTYDKGTVIRTVLLLLALVNQTLLMFGKSPLDISEEQVNQLADTFYAAGSVLFTVVTTLAAWFKNNYVTEKGKRQQSLLKQNNLTK
ncbi:phage holin [Bacillus atrophaeus]|uniref:Bacteriophage PBSX holin n=1 Tax=Bacillus atrophaeus (strain 1942) TaxID=720555 RepID=A0ABM5LV84_BACA1|nr:MULTISPECIES: phage holin [Bacillus]AMR63300.1 holin [Bacillus subtilis subsp. globigii]MBT2624680.1 phage holin [Bacillus sp. ISL-32]ADP31769.1 bacteriophage PBSX holin [Bacillus atrophaeus 1942]AIK47622.1 holin, SPP1 family [Bacillus atrophaeus subsp. globigii]AKL84033.1 XhlB [Bacillus atrophaeus UCMB-5137]